MNRLRLIWRFLQDAWRAGGADPSICRLCGSPLDLPAEDVREAVAFARNAALRAGERALAQALHDVLLLHINGTLPEVWPKPPAPADEAVN